MFWTQLLKYIFRHSRFTKPLNCFGFFSLFFWRPEYSSAVLDTTLIQIRFTSNNSLRGKQAFSVQSTSKRSLWGCAIRSQTSGWHNATFWTTFSVIGFNSFNLEDNASNWKRIWFHLICVFFLVLKTKSWCASRWHASHFKFISTNTLNVNIQVISRFLGYARAIVRWFFFFLQHNNIIACYKWLLPRVY